MIFFRHCFLALSPHAISLAVLWKHTMASAAVFSLGATMSMRDAPQLPHCVLAHASSMLAYWDTDLICRYASDAYWRWFGASPTRVVGRHLHELLGQEAFSATEPHIQAVLGGRTQVVEVAMPGPDGRRRHARAHYHPDVVDTVVVGIIAELADITPALADGARLALALESAQLGVWQWDLRTSALLWENARSRAIFGMDDGARWIDSGVFCAQYLHPDDAAGFSRAMASFTLTGAGFYFQGRYRRRGDPAVRWMECFGEMMECDAAGVKLVGIVADVTGRMTTSQALLRTAADLTETQARRADFLSILGHELRNCMAPIGAGIRVLAGNPSTAAIEQVSSAMGRQLRHMERLVDDIYDLRRAQGGELALQRAITSLGAVVQAAGDMARPAMHAAGHSFIVHLPNADLLVDGDLVRLTQAVANLLANAAKFTPPGGRIVLTLQADRDGMASIIVRDSGIGIAPDMLETVFGMYVKAAAPTGIAADGLGIGLYLARRLVQLHGGSLTAASGGAHQGTTMLIRIPCIAAAGRDATSA
jgi:signal transduction histidine kinase